MAVYFNASADYISIADNAKWTLTPVTDDKALSLKYKSSSIPNVDTEYQCLLLLSNGSGNKLQIILYNNSGVNTLMIMTRDSGWVVTGYFYAVWSPSVNTEYDIVINLGADSACNIYIDGVSQSLTYGTWSDNTEINPTILRFGTDGATINDNTTLSHVAWWDDKLTQDEVDILRWNPRWCLGHPDLLAYFPCDEGSGTTCRDHSASSGQTVTDGTFNGTPTWVDDPPIMKMASPVVLWDEAAADDLIIDEFETIVLNEDIESTESDLVINEFDLLSLAEDIIAETIGVVLEQEGFRWRNDDESEILATWKQLQDIDATTLRNVNIRLRFLINASDNPDPTQFKIQYKKTSASAWRDMPES